MNPALAGFFIAVSKLSLYVFQHGAENKNNNKNESDFDMKNTTNTNGDNAFFELAKNPKLAVVMTSAKPKADNDSPIFDLVKLPAVQITLSPVLESYDPENCTEAEEELVPYQRLVNAALAFVIRDYVQNRLGDRFTLLYVSDFIEKLGDLAEVQEQSARNAAVVTDYLTKAGKKAGFNENDPTWIVLKTEFENFTKWPAGNRLCVLDLMPMFILDNVLIKL